MLFCIFSQFCVCVHFFTCTFATEFGYEQKKARNQLITGSLYVYVLVFTSLNLDTFQIV